MMSFSLCLPAEIFLKFTSSQRMLSKTSSRRSIRRPFFQRLADVCISGVTEGGVALENEPATVSFPFHEGKEGQTAVFGPDEKMDAYFKTSYVELGSSLAYKGVGSVGQQTMLQPAQQDGQAVNGANGSDGLCGLRLNL